MFGITSEQAWGIARTILAAVGGYFVAQGWVSNEVMIAIISGLGTIFVAVWSWYSKTGTGTSVLTAVKTDNLETLVAQVKP